MPVIQVNDKPYTLKPGQTRVGSGSEADISLAGDASLGVQALITLAADNTTVIRRAGTVNSVKVNGMVLGAEPTPLFHGDKVEVAGVELLFSDDKKSGATQYVSASEIAAIAAAKRAGPARATAATGGRLVSLVDGKEYTIADAGLVIGRDASCGVVVAQTDVSRQHARIAPGQTGYMVTDQSANGVFVNGERIQGSQLLARADVIRIGSEEFRFYADVAPVARPVAPAVVAPTPPPVLVPSAAPVTPAPFVEPPTTPSPMRSSTGTTPPPSKPAAVPAADPRPVLATLEILNEGPSKGKRFELRSPLAHVGRGAHNDVVLADESVSDSHAKLQRRDDGWYVVDMGSTNGTYVGGKRIDGERKLEGAPDLRFGGVKMTLRPIIESDAGKGTRAIATPRASAHAAAAPIEQKKGGVPGWVWIVLAVVVIAAVAVFIMKG